MQALENPGGRLVLPRPFLSDPRVLIRVTNSIFEKFLSDPRALIGVTNSCSHIFLCDLSPKFFFFSHIFLSAHHPPLHAQMKLQLSLLGYGRVSEDEENTSTVTSISIRNLYNYDCFSSALPVLNGGKIN